MSNYFLQNNCKEQRIIICLVYFVICTQYESSNDIVRVVKKQLGQICSVLKTLFLQHS